MGHGTIDAPFTPAESPKAKRKVIRGKKSIQIFVLHRGWVVVGVARKDGEQVIIEKGNVIRQWGTTKGLGEIAIGGPTDKTRLDKCGTIRVHKLAVVMSMDCDAKKWASSVSD